MLYRRPRARSPVGGFALLGVPVISWLLSCVEIMDDLTVTAQEDSRRLCGGVETSAPHVWGRPGQFSPDRLVNCAFRDLCPG